MNCPTCGTDLADNAVFCRTCGTTINQVSYPNSVATKPARTYNAGHFAVMGGCLLCLISCYVPFLSMSMFGMKESLTLSDGTDSVVFSVIAIGTIIFSFLRVDIVNIILTLIQGGFVVYEISIARQEIEKLGGYSSMVSYEVGYYFLIFGGIIAFLGAITGLSLRIKAKKEFRQTNY